MIMYNTGCRVSELVGLRVNDLTISKGGTSSIRFWGKGRKERVTPIWQSTAEYINKFVAANVLSGDDALFKNKQGGSLTRSGVSQRLAVITSRATPFSPSLSEKNVTPHTFRHSTAMNLLQAGVDISTIAIWLGHESIETTHKYMVADMEVKRKAMGRLSETSDRAFNYKPSKSLLAFLASL